jgi:hypothetical protein
MSCQSNVGEEIRTRFFDSFRARLSLPLRRSSITRRSYGAKLGSNSQHHLFLERAVSPLRPKCSALAGFSICFQP